ncbi:hypothetical protein I4U23_030069 [Adineta vaga]|nr:hypothetical protein I4U23_030069 [Adineta vaga]
MTHKRSKTSLSTIDSNSNSSINPLNFQLKQKEREENNSILIRELILYGLCLIIICAISFGRTNDSTYYFTNMLTKAFVTLKTNDANSFNDIAQNNGDDFWKAIQGPIFSQLYNIHRDKSNLSKTNYGYIFNENKILGVPRLRQVRIKPNSCKLHKEFAKRNFTQQCYAAYTIDQEDQSSFGNNQLNIYTSDAWNYTSADVTETDVYKGMVSQYNGGGYVQLLTRNAITTMKILEELNRNSWINRGTRAVFFDTIVYNPNINLFCHICLLAEYPSSENHYPNFNNLFTLKINSDFYLGLTLALTWLKIFKYLNLNKTMLLLNKTMSSCLNEIFAFTCIFSIIFLAYTQFGWIFFGRYLTDWRSFPGSIFTLFRMIIGDFDFYAMLNVDETVGPLFLFTYIYFVYFVLLNMFLAIINDTYSRIISDQTLQTFYIQGFSKLFSKKLKKNSYIDNERKKPIENLDKEQIKLNENHEDKNKSDINTKLSYDEYLILNQYVDQIENQITDYIHKIQEILNNLDDLHKTTADQNKILSNISKKTS